MKIFPLVVRPEPDVTITLYADGTCHGNSAILSLFLARMLATDRALPTTVLTAIGFWLLMRALQDDNGRERTAR